MDFSNIFLRNSKNRRIVNFLAHTYLSGCNEEIIVGNFMGDYVKGRNYLLFPEQVKKGISDSPGHRLFYRYAPDYPEE